MGRGGARKRPKVGRGDSPLPPQHMASFPTRGARGPELRSPPPTPRNTHSRRWPIRVVMVACAPKSASFYARGCSAVPWGICVIFGCGTQKLK